MQLAGSSPASFALSTSAGVSRLIGRHESRARFQPFSLGMGRGGTADGQSGRLAPGERWLRRAV